MEINTKTHYFPAVEQLEPERDANSGSERKLRQMGESDQASALTLNRHCRQMTLD